MAPHRTKVAFLYGISEGPLLTTRFRRALRNKGYEIASSPEKADIIITHSAGCYLIPKQHTASQVIMVAPCYDFPRSKPFMTAYKVARDLTYAVLTKQIAFWLYKTFWNIFYFIFRPVHSIRTYQYSKTRSHHLPHIKAKEVIIISYKRDPWSSQVIDHADQHPEYEFKHIDGVHDDIWYNPGSYIALLK